MTAPWRREDAIAAVLRFYDEHGRLPVDKEWEKAQPGRPATRTIRRRWGWHQLLADALEIAPEHVPVEQEAEISADRVKEAVADWYRRFGKLPTRREWDRAGPGRPRTTGARLWERPAARTIQQRWGWHQLLADALDVPVIDVLHDNPQGWQAACWMVMALAPCFWLVTSQIAWNQTRRGLWVSWKIVPAVTDVWCLQREHSIKSRPPMFQPPPP